MVGRNPVHALAVLGSGALRPERFPSTEGKQCAERRHNKSLEHSGLEFGPSDPLTVQIHVVLV